MIGYRIINIDKKTKKVKAKKPKKATKMRVEISIDTVKDKKMVEKLNSVPNRSDYIRSLIAKDIKSEVKK